MINKDRIVPITRTDLISMYAFVLKCSFGSGIIVLPANDAEGNFFLENAPLEGGAVIANEPVSTFDFSTDVSAVDVYFVPAYDYAGFTQDGAALAVSGDEVDADGCSLYSASLADGAITMEKLSY